MDTYVGQSHQYAYKGEINRYYTSYNFSVLYNQVFIVIRIGRL